MRQWIIGIVTCGLILWSLGLVVVRWYQVKTTSDLDPSIIHLKITSLGGGAEVPQPMDEWPPSRAAWSVYQEFRRQNPNIALLERDTLRLNGQAGESAILMSMAGRTAGDIISVNYR